MVHAQRLHSKPTDDIITHNSKTNRWRGRLCDSRCMTTVQGQNVEGQGHITYHQLTCYNLATDSHINLKCEDYDYEGQ